MDEERTDKNWCIVILKFIGLYWRAFFSIIWPFVAACSFLLGFDPKFRCMFIVVLMAGYWVTECIPLYITGMIPIVLMPLFGILSSGDVCARYFTQTNALFLGGLFLAISIEHCGLHNRIALGAMLLIGCSPRRLHFGITFVTMLLSMFLINSATTAMMCPIIMAVLKQLEEEGIGTVYIPRTPEDDPEAPDAPTNVTKAFFLTAAYASTIGGIGTLVGTGTNITFAGIFEKKFPGGETIKFVDWMAFNSVAMLIITFLMWLSLQFLLMGLWRKNSPDGQIVQKGSENSSIIRGVIKGKYDELGPVSFQEGSILGLFLICIVLWLSQSPQIFKGWGDFYDKNYKPKSSVPPVGIIILFACIPISCVFWKFCTKKVDDRPKKVSSGLVPWSVFQQKMPWGILFLLGGGFAISAGGDKSGLSIYLGSKMKGLSAIPSFVVLGLTSFCASLATELTANVAICNLIMPILVELAVVMEVHPMYLAFPAAVCCSFAFLMPVGTPPNAIVVENCKLKTIHMIKNGLPTKFFSWLVVVVLFPTYGRLYYDIGEFPDWAKPTE